MCSTLGFSRSSLVVLLLGVFTYAYASIHCPDDITIACHMSYTDTQMTGHATVYGSWHGVARYFDDTELLDRCNVGTVIRTWYDDKNYNYILDSGEASCTQRITIEDISQTFTISFPDDRTYSCIDDIVDEYPIYQGGICDQIAVNVSDEDFSVVPNACYKIIRTYTVLNWCDYRPADPDWNGEGIWVGTQTIRVIDDQAPQLQYGGDITIPLDASCQASNITLGNIATDSGSCPSSELQYALYLDLDHDGSFDTRYSYLDEEEYFIMPAGSGDSVSIELVEHLAIGSYKYKWSVNDGCGNFHDQSGNIIVADLKPPTPYCITVLHATVGGPDMPLTIKPQIFDRGSFDNCSGAEQISLSFSEDITDTIRIVNCDNAGIQFYRIYATDEFGNSDYCSAFMLAFDNGNCGFGFSANGSVALPDGSTVPNVEVEIVDPAGNMLGSQLTGMDGLFVINDLELFADRIVRTDASDYDLDSQVDIADAVIMRDHALGIRLIDNLYGRMAGDLSGDGLITGRDMRILVDHLVGLSSDDAIGDMNLMARDLDNLQAQAGGTYTFSDYDGSFDYSAYVVGDVDFSAGPYLQGEGREISSAGKVTLSYEDGYTVLTPIRDMDLEAMHIVIDGATVLPQAIGPAALETNSEDNRTAGVMLSSCRWSKLMPLRVEGRFASEDIHVRIVAADGERVVHDLEIIADATVSSTQEALVDAVSVYPNPVVDRLFLSQAVNQVIIYDMAGVVVLQIGGGAVTSVDVSRLNPGVYNMTMATEEGPIQQIHRLVKLN